MLLLFLKQNIQKSSSSLQREVLISAHEFTCYFYILYNIFVFIIRNVLFSQLFLLFLEIIKKFNLSKSKHKESQQNDYQLILLTACNQSP